MDGTVIKVEAKKEAVKVYKVIDLLLLFSCLSVRCLD